jgi:catechol 2,3-dioxygenase-like lactoylglutathione lyase family enzyme
MLGHGFVAVGLVALACGVQACGEDDRLHEDARPATADTSSLADASLPADAQVIPNAMTPFVWGAGLGVTDLTAATAFFVDFLDLEVESRAQLADRQEVTLWSRNKRGSHLVLTKYNDGRNTRDVAAKLLFLVKGTEALYARLLAAGYASRFPTVAVPGSTEAVAQVEGPDGYAVEISQYATEDSFFVSLGFAVDDAAASESFYQTALGMVRTSEYPLGGTMFGSVELPDEFVMSYPGGAGAGAALVLMSYRSRAFNTRDNPVKSVHYVSDVAAAVARALMAGASTVTSPASSSGAKANAVVKDPDGYLVELVER